MMIGRGLALLAFMVSVIVMSCFHTNRHSYRVVRPHASLVQHWTFSWEALSWVPTVHACTPPTEECDGTYPKAYGECTSNRACNDWFCENGTNYAKKCTSGPNTYPCTQCTLAQAAQCIRRP